MSILTKKHWLVLLKIPLRANYNLQISTNNQYISNYTVGQTTTDTTLLKAHIKDFIDSYKGAPDKRYSRCWLWK